jgi:hypothetical protein
MGDDNGGRVLTGRIEPTTEHCAIDSFELDVRAVWSHSLESLLEGSIICHIPLNFVSGKAPTFISSKTPDLPRYRRFYLLTIEYLKTRGKID